MSCIMTLQAAVKLIPRPPAFVDSMNINRSGVLLKLFIIVSLKQEEQIYNIKYIKQLYKDTPSRAQYEEMTTPNSGQLLRSCEVTFCAFVLLTL